MKTNQEKTREKVQSLWGKFCRKEITFEEYEIRKKEIETKYLYEDAYVYRSYKEVRNEGKGEDEV